MPRGKIASEMLNFKVDSNDAGATEEEKTGSTKFTLIEPDMEEDNEDNSLVQAVHNDFADTIESSKPNFKFTLLLVTLFVAVNIGLIALLDNNKNTSVEQVRKDNGASDVVVDLKTQKPAVPDSIGRETQPEKPVLTGETPAPRSGEVERPVLATEPGIEKSVMNRQPQPAPAPTSQDLLSILGRY